MDFSWFFQRGSWISSDSERGKNEPFLQQWRNGWKKTLLSPWFFLPFETAFFSLGVPWCGSLCREVKLGQYSVGGPGWKLSRSRNAHLFCHGKTEWNSSLNGHETSIWIATSGRVHSYLSTFRLVFFPHKTRLVALGCKPSEMIIDNSRSPAQMLQHPKVVQGSTNMDTPYGC